MKLRLVLLEMKEIYVGREEKEEREEREEKKKMRPYFFFAFAVFY
jgi:hypothetical protein